MKTILNNYYHKYFAELMTSILVLLVINIFLSVFGIVSARKQREENLKIDLMDRKNKTDTILKSNENVIHHLETVKSIIKK